MTQVTATILPGSFVTEMTQVTATILPGSFVTDDDTGNR